MRIKTLVVLALCLSCSAFAKTSSCGSIEVLKQQRDLALSQLRALRAGQLDRADLQAVPKTPACDSSYIAQALANERDVRVDLLNRVGSGQLPVERVDFIGLASHQMNDYVLQPHADCSDYHDCQVPGLEQSKLRPGLFRAEQFILPEPEPYAGPQPRCGSDTDYCN